MQRRVVRVLLQRGFQHRQRLARSPELLAQQAREVQPGQQEMGPALHHGHQRLARLLEAVQARQRGGMAVDDLRVVGLQPAQLVPQRFGLVPALAVEQQLGPQVAQDGRIRFERGQRFDGGLGRAMVPRLQQRFGPVQLRRKAVCQVDAAADLVLGGGDGRPGGDHRDRRRLARGRAEDLSGDDADRRTGAGRRVVVHGRSEWRHCRRTARRPAPRAPTQGKAPMHSAGARGYIAVTRKRRPTPRPRGTEETSPVLSEQSFSVPRDAPFHQPTLVGRLFFVRTAGSGCFLKRMNTFRFDHENGKALTTLHRGWFGAFQLV